MKMTDNTYQIADALRSYTGYAFLIFMNTIIWEHIARINAFAWKPTFFLDKIADKLMEIFYHLGKFFAHISSFIKYLHLDEFSHTFKDLTFAIIRLVLSCTDAIGGYFDFIRDWKFEVSTVMIGSVVIWFVFLIIISAVVLNVRQSQRQNNDWMWWRYPRATPPCRNLPEKQE
jgi:hypothetical protein